MMQKAMQNIRLPYPKNATLEEKTKYDKVSQFLNENFKTLFDGVDELTVSIKTQAELQSMMKELTDAMAEINAKLDELTGGS